MGDPKITTFFISLVLVGLFTTIIGLVIADLSTTYGADNSNIDLSTYNQLANLSRTAENIQDKSNIEEKTGVIDIIGGYISSAYSAIFLTAQSINLFDNMAENALLDSDLGAAGQYLKTAIYTIVIILIFVGVFLAALLKWKL